MKKEKVKHDLIDEVDKKIEGVNVRVYRPVADVKKPINDSAIMVYYHGGGYAYGVSFFLMISTVKTKN